MHRIFQREKHLLDNNHWKRRGLAYFKSYNSTLDFQRSLACGIADDSPAENEKRWGKKEMFFPLLKVFMRMKRIFCSDLDLLKFRETRGGVGVSRKRNNSEWKDLEEQTKSIRSRSQLSPLGSQVHPGCVCLALGHRDISKQGSSVRKSLEFVNSHLEFTNSRCEFIFREIPIYWVEIHTWNF